MNASFFDLDDGQEFWDYLMQESLHTQESFSCRLIWYWDFMLDLALRPHIRKLAQAIDEDVMRQLA
jgi:hypothetical protein